MPIRGGERGSAGNRRGILLLSLILLVWNLLASALRAVPVVLPPDADRIAAVPLPSPADDDNVARSAESPRSGPLTIRQRYLLGKRVDINTASLRELSELPGISDEVAAALVAARVRMGGFRSPEDLLGVKGIKARRLRKILPFLSGMRNN